MCRQAAKKRPACWPTHHQYPTPNTMTIREHTLITSPVMGVPAAKEMDAKNRIMRAKGTLNCQLLGELGSQEVTTRLVALTTCRSMSGWRGGRGAGGAGGAGATAWGRTGLRSSTAQEEGCEAGSAVSRKDQPFARWRK